MLDSNLSNKKLFIFDMDGLLIDSGKLSYRIYLKAAKKFDFEVNKKVYFTITGKTELGICNSMKKIYGEDADIYKWREYINNERNEEIYKLSNSIIKNGAKEIIDFAKLYGIKIALATSNSMDKVKLYFNNTDIISKFDCIITGDDVRIGKPNPDIFLSACNLLGISTKEALVFEDSFIGLEASNNANIDVIWIPDTLENLGSYSGSKKILIELNTLINKDIKYLFKFKNLIEAKEYLEKIFY